MLCKIGVLISTIHLAKAPPEVQSLEQSRRSQRDERVLGRSDCYSFNAAKQARTYTPYSVLLPMSNVGLVSEGRSARVVSLKIKLYQSPAKSATGLSDFGAPNFTENKRVAAGTLGAFISSVCQGRRKGGRRSPITDRVVSSSATHIESSSLIKRLDLPLVVLCSFPS